LGPVLHQSGVRSPDQVNNNVACSPNIIKLTMWPTVHNVGARSPNLIKLTTMWPVVHNARVRSPNIINNVACSPQCWGL
jgi:hypothetical protein